MLDWIFKKIEQFICIKMDLALNNLQWLICHQTKTNQLINQSTSFNRKSPQVSRTLVCKPILTMQGSRRSWFFLWFSISPVFFPRLWGSFQVHHLQMVSPSPSCSTAFLSSRAKSEGLSVFLLSFIFMHLSPGTSKSTKWRFLFSF